MSLSWPRQDGRTGGDKTRTSLVYATAQKLFGFIIIIELLILCASVTTNLVMSGLPSETPCAAYERGEDVVC